MKKGVLEMCVLAQIKVGDMYGYELMKRIQSAFPDVYDGSVYAVLRRLSGDGSTTTYEAPAVGGPARKYYKITETGVKYLESLVSEWKSIQTAVNILLNF